MKKEYGFTLVEGLLITLIVAVVGFAGYYVWNQNNESESEETLTTQNQTSEIVEDDNEEAVEVEETASVTTSDGWIIVVPEGWSNEDGDVTSPNYKVVDAPVFAIDTGALISVSTDEANAGSGLEELAGINGDDYNSKSSTKTVAGTTLVFNTYEHNTKGETYRGVGQDGKVYKIDFRVSAQNNDDYKENAEYDVFVKFLEQFVELN